MLVFNIISIFCMVSPPFLAFFVWKKFLESQHCHKTDKWRTLIGWIAVLSVSGLFVVCVFAFFTIPCDVRRYGWGCVAKWRAFSAGVVRVSPLFLVLAAFGKRGTRILSVLWVIAINFDCLMIDMTA